MKFDFAKALKYVRSSDYRFLIQANKGKYDSMPDDEYLKRMFKARLGYDLDLDNPRTYNEKLQWLKLHDRKAYYTTLVDKYEFKNYISEKIGREYTVPTLEVWDRVEDIDYSRLPDSFVLKCTHDSQSTIVCKDKSSFDTEAATQKMNKHMSRNFFLQGREWPYKNVKPRIIAEPFMVDESGIELKDYKVFCFNGVPDYIEVDFNRFIQHKLNPYDFDWNPLHFCDKSKNDYSVNIPKPIRLDDMRDIAEKLSKGIAFARVDFYSIYDRIYVGEITLYPGSGFIEFDPKDVDMRLGAKLKLP